MIAELGCQHDEQIDGSGNLLSYADASFDFGDGALVISCPCGKWAIEDSSGAVVARSDEHVVVELAAAHAA